eukprot:CAMPEP_0170567768 /NCGR_PEP_ID=MMETSP0211-20121228/80698_1 /TAXON_ID=311385 /ORGANISM="Pseudokeronopsis sp., Strain OXSARD2" /LENGTH=111 /DNA_ID=CAMNT_0010889329 /DNA_START=1855 /DNA_END=2190 /DNA_ORIENTATION=+
MVDPEATYSAMMRFMLKAPDIEGCAIQKYIELVCREKAPEVYTLKADKKKIKECQHLGKYLKEDLDFIYEHCKDLLFAFGYDKIFTENGPPDYFPEYVTNFNHKSLMSSIH